MKLLTKALEKKLPKLRSQDGKGKEALAHVKLFTPWTHWTWYITEYDPETKECFGLVEGDENELGYFSLEELASITGPMGLKIERDLYFESTPLSQL